MPYGTHYGQKQSSISKNTDMRTRHLLSLGMLLASGLGLQAQTLVFHEGFDATQGKTSGDVGYYEYINLLTNDNGTDERTIATDGQKAGAGCLSIYNVSPWIDGDNSDLTKHDQWWQRAVKFRNLPLEEGKAYRLTYYLKGDNTWNNGESDVKGKMSVALMQGGENADIPLMDADGNEFRYTQSYFNPDAYEKYTKMFYFASEALQKEKYAESHSDELADTYFATINVYNPGQYYLDEVSLYESSIAGVSFDQDVIRVDFGFGTNVADLVSASDKGRVIMPTDCATVSVNGESRTVIGVELHKDGYLYIYLDENTPIASADDKVEVAFKNPTDLSYQVVYKGTLAPSGAAPDFSGEQGEYLEGVANEVSYAYTEPTLVSVSPVDGSFGLDETLTEVTFTFDKPVMTVNVDNGETLVAKLNDTEDMVLVTKPEYEADGTTEKGSTTLTFQRSGGKAFSKGSYTVTLDGVSSAKYVTSYETFTTNFETGQIAIAKETLTPVATYNFDTDAANTIPEGWTVNNEGSILAGGTSVGSGPRLFTFADGGDVKNALYLRCKLDDNGASTGGYAMKDEAVTLPAGDLRIQFLGFCWKGGGLKVDAEILDESGTTVIAHQEGAFDNSVDGATSKQAECSKVTVAMNNPSEGNYRLRLTVVPTTTSWSEVMFGGVVVNTYTKTEGESTEAEVEFQDKDYGGANGASAGNNCAPTEESGWELYQGGAVRTPGGDFNYNGSRIFTGLAAKNLSAAYYTGTGAMWPSDYVVYGKAGYDGAPALHLKAGRTQFTYYAANWKEKEHAVDHIVYFELAGKESGDVIYSRNDKIVDCNMNGSRNTTIAATKIQFVVNVPEEGDYTIKLGGTTEQFIGNYTIEKLGSQAAYYLGLINTAREAALSELTSSADAAYDGTTKTNLQASVDKYADPTFVHTSEEVNAAVEELETLTKQLATRREYVVRYAQAKENAATALAKAGATEEHEATKYASLEAYTLLQGNYDKYAAYTAQQLEDDDLVASTTDLENHTALLNNLMDKGIGLLTKQLVDAAALVVAQDDSKSDNEQVLAAGNALTDDQALASQLKLLATKAIYDNCAAGDPFAMLDPETAETITDSLDLSCYIQNQGLYSTETSDNKNLNDANNLPGWEVDMIKGTPGLCWSWNTYDASEYNPVGDRYFVAGWNSEFDLHQTVLDLPVGQYRLVVGTQDRGFNDTSDNKTAALSERDHWTVKGTTGSDEIEGEILSYIWWETAGKRDSVGFDISGQGQYYDLTDCHSRLFDVPATSNSMGEATIGSHLVQFQSMASTDNFRLYLVGKDPSFDYAAAAKKVEEQLSTGIESTKAPEGEPVSTRYYNVNGVQTTTPSGVTIQVDTYGNGYVKVTKKVVK